MTPYLIDLATTDDAEAIATVMLSTTEREFSRLQRGTIEDADNTSRIASKFRKIMTDPAQLLVVARVGETREVVAVAQWVLKEREVVPTPEERARAREEIVKSLDPRLNIPFITEIRKTLGDMEYDIVQGRKHWHLDNLATLPKHRRQGLAGRLVEWPLAKADEEGIVCFLTTDEGGNGESLYAKHGFEKVAHAVFDLAQYGGSGLQAHIGMLRNPRNTE